MQDQSFKADRASRPGRRVLVRVFAAAVIFVGLLAVGYALIRLLAAQDRPPIIVKGGSIIFENADLKDASGTVVVPRRPWSKDLTGNEYKPSHWGAKSVKHFEIFDAAKQPCGSGTEVSITYKEGNIEQRFQLKPRKWNGILQKEPKLKVLGNATLTNDGPYKLKYGAKDQGTITIGAGPDSCTAPWGSAEFEIRMVPE
jgi:hypothetical protein